MTPLSDLLQELKVECIPFISQNNALKEHWINAQSSLFVTVCENKPNTDVKLHLLGLLTKSHIEASAQYEHSALPSQKMQQVLSETLGDEYAMKFNNQLVLEVILITHLWLYTQGYLNMDDSLAYDHAQQSLQMLLPELAFLKIDADELLQQFIHSYQLGKQANPKQDRGILHMLKRYKNWFCR